MFMLPTSADDTLPWPLFAGEQCPISWRGVYKKWKVTNEEGTTYYDINKLRDVKGGKLVSITQMDGEKNVIAYGRAYVAKGQNYIAAVLLRVDNSLEDNKYGSWVIVSSQSKYTPGARLNGYPMDEALVCIPKNVQLVFRTSNLNASESKRTFRN